MNMCHCDYVRTLLYLNLNFILYSIYIVSEVGSYVRILVNLSLKAHCMHMGVMGVVLFKIMYHYMYVGRPNQFMNVLSVFLNYRTKYMKS